jgi:hypothetical protein
MKDAIEPFIDDKKRLLNVGEVMNLWFFLSGSLQTLRNEQVAYNTVQDEELKEKIEDAVNNLYRPSIKELSEFLTKEGVPLPNQTPEEPIGDFRTIPEGAKLSDVEVAQLMSFNLALAMTYATRGLTESIRADVGLIFANILTKRAAFNLTFRQLLVKKGWLKVPPYYHKG